MLCWAGGQGSDRWWLPPAHGGAHLGWAGKVCVGMRRAQQPSPAQVTLYGKCAGQGQAGRCGLCGDTCPGAAWCIVIMAGPGHSVRGHHHHHHHCHDGGTLGWAGLGWAGLGTPALLTWSAVCTSPSTTPPVQSLSLPVCRLPTNHSPGSPRPANSSACRDYALIWKLDLDRE